MDYIDFNSKKETIIYQILHSNENINNQDSIALYDYFRYLHFFRHNYLHYLVLESLGYKWLEEKPLQDVLEIILPKEYALKTPDIYHVQNNIKYLIDVSISNDIHKTKIQKENKYQPIVDWLHKNDVKSTYIHINVHTNYSNLEVELEKIKHCQLKEFDTLTFFRTMSIIEDKKQWVNEYIDKEIFEQLKNKDKTKNIPEDNTPEINFQDNIKYENIGLYSDLDVDLDLFKKYNDSYTNVEELIESNKEFDEKELVSYLTNILESKNEVYNKYKDETLTKNQFDEAHEQIIKLNNTFEVREPKPTHHLLIPFAEDIEPTIEIKREQAYIIDFMNDYLQYFEKINIDDRIDKTLFLRDLFSEIINSLTKSVDEKINNEIFNNKEDILDKEKYHNIKNKKDIYEHYLKTKKVSSKLLEKIKSKIDKKNKIEVENLMRKLKLELQNYGDEKLTTLHSYRDYLRSNNKIYEDNNVTYAKDNKVFKVSFKNFSEMSKQCYIKTGISRKIDESLKIPVQTKKTIKFENSVHIDEFLEYMSNSNIYNYDYKESEFLMKEENIGVDSEEAMGMKKESIKNYTMYYDILKKTNAYNYSRNLHNCYQQLMHAVQINTGPRTFYTYNSGIKNLIIIVAMNYNSKKQDDGKSFMSIIKTRNPELYTKLFGKIYKIKVGEFYYVLTNWRKLKLSKITFMRDVFYSTVSSTMNTIMSSAVIPNYFKNRKIEYIFSLRTLVAYSTNQKIGELLVDTRYAFMSALSVYTNINKLLIEKFGPCYTTAMECWIVKRLMIQLPKINQEAMTDGILQTRIEMTHNVRDINTIGGLIRLSSLWGDYIMTDITELLDEAFVYVHTMKEPANIYHENVKALKIIHNFQKEYDGLPYKIKKGLLNNRNDWDFFLKYPTKIGCSGSIIINSTIHTINKEKPFFKKIIHKINNESIGEILSTKAVISDLEREVIEQPRTTKRDIKKKMKRILTHDEKPDVSEMDKIKSYIMVTKSKYYSKHKPRQKVMETILGKIENNKNLDTTVKFANDFILTEKGKVLADICIKSQYGAKREFYVINIGAKTLARVCENFFKELCLTSPNEAISIAGDKKILSMQSMLDRIYYNNITQNHKLMYVNGDCTKWSAAETMSSFLSMCIALKSRITPKMYEMLCATFNSWGKKSIQIPIDIYNKVVPTTKHDTIFLKYEASKQNATIESTQNFLQGMFNYSSSYKAVCCINYTYYIWKKIYPNSKLILEHMEHSDDYVLIVLYEDLKEFEKFRVLQKIMMRFHGYNDSDRKTSCQPFLMEFVSQISFNGVMLYPQIKKSKEVNLNLPCTGFKTDMEAALSRVGECSRVGCNQGFLYFFQRWHCYLVANAYSILPNMENNYERDYLKLLNEPIELFGFPDCLPLFSLYCRGNGNNYRLYTYGTENIKKKILYLYDKAQETLIKEDFLSEDIEYKYSIQAPRFLYEIQNKSIRNLRRNIEIKNEEIDDFWKNHLSYKLLKPINIECLIIWIKCMFFNRTFLEAYAKTSRTMMTMRLSRFVKVNIIKEMINISDYTVNLNKLILESMTMKEYYYKHSVQLNDFSTKKHDDFYYNSLQKVLTKCDPTYSAIYSILKQISISYVKTEKTKTIQVAIKTPSRLKTINIVNQPHILLQYLYNKNDFILDNRVLISKESLDKDILEIKERIPSALLKSKETMSILSVYNDLMINKEKRIVMFGYSRHCSLLIDSITDTIVYNFLPGYILQINYKNIITIRDPINNQLLYTKGMRLTVDYFRQAIDNICLLYVYLKYYNKLSNMEVSKIIKTMKFNIKLENENIEMTSKQILQKTTPQYIKNFTYTLEDRKIIGYIKVVLLNDYDVLDDLTNSIYTFTYKYITTDTPIGGKYEGYTELQFTYFNTTCKAIYDPKYCSNPIMIVNKYYQGLEAVHYNVALKLTIGIPDSEFEKTISVSRISILDFDNLQKLTPLFIKQNLKYIVKKYGNMNQIVKWLDAKPGDVFLPILLTKEVLYRGGDKSLNLTKARPTCVEENMSIYLGKSKLYTLPFWKCIQYDNSYLNPDIVINNISINQLLLGRRLEKFIKGKLNKHNDIIVLEKITPQQEYTNILKEITKHKIYDIDFSTILSIDIEDKINLKETITCVPILNKTYELKFLKNENIFIVNKEINYEQIFKHNVGLDLGKEEKTPSSKPTFENIEIPMDDFFLEEEDYNSGIKIEQIDNTETTLKKAAQNMVFDDSFNDLIEEDNTDIAKIGNMMLEFDDFDIIEEEFGRGQYLREELYSIKGSEVKLSDIFVSKPEKNKKQKKEGAGYMLTKLCDEESIYIQSLFFQKNIDRTTTYLSLPNFIQNLNYIVAIINHKLINNDTDIQSSLLFLYKLLCKTFILNKCNDHDTKTFKIVDRKIVFCLRVENNYTSEQIKKLLEKNLIMEKIETKLTNYLIIKCNYNLFEKQYQKDLITGVDTKISLFLSEEINNNIITYYVQMTKNTNLFEEFLI
jgi:hypothetical protein